MIGIREKARLTLDKEYESSLLSQNMTHAHKNCLYKQKKTKIRKVHGHKNCLYKQRRTKIRKVSRDKGVTMIVLLLCYLYHIRVCR